MQKSDDLEFIDIAGKAASVSEAVRTRHSVREFDSRPVEINELRELIDDSLRSPSWKNSQPWNIHVVTGEKKASLSAKLVSLARSQDPAPDTAWAAGFPSNIKKRMFDLGMKLYGIAGIDRKDKEARDNFMVRNFEFFDAPVALFITTRCELNFYVGIDIGCYLSTLMLLARERGMSSCAQASLSSFPEVVRADLGLPEEDRLICGLSLGYPLADSPVNRYHTPRESFESLVKFY